MGTEPRAPWRRGRSARWSNDDIDGGPVGFNAQAWGNAINLHDHVQPWKVLNYSLFLSLASSFLWHSTGLFLSSESFRALLLSLATLKIIPWTLDLSVFIDKWHSGHASTADTECFKTPLRSALFMSKKPSCSWSPSSTSFYTLEAPKLSSGGKNSSLWKARVKTISLSGIEPFLFTKNAFRFCWWDALM